MSKKINKREIDLKDLTDDFDDDFGSIETEDNRIYYYSEVDRDSVLRLIMSIRSTTNKFLNRAIMLEQPINNIFLHINSQGGSVFEGLLACDIVRKNKIPIYTIVDGSCASAATFISVVGKKRYIRENSYMLIHQLSSQMHGTFKEIKDEYENCLLLMNKIKQIYTQYTKLPIKKLEEILDHDLLLSASECLKYKLVDEII